MNNYRNMQVGNGRSSRSVIERRLQSLDFAINETVLYLDVYPDSRKALAYYHRLCRDRDNVMKEYEAEYGPVTYYGNSSTDEWQWIKGPWPWEYSAN